LNSALARGGLLGRLLRLLPWVLGLLTLLAWLVGLSALLRLAFVVLIHVNLQFFQI
jgi:hypothetical protein